MVPVVVSAKTANRRAQIDQESVLSSVASRADGSARVAGTIRAACSSPSSAALISGYGNRIFFLFFFLCVMFYFSKKKKKQMSKFVCEYCMTKFV